jgi:hypothetical protein
LVWRQGEREGRAIANNELAWCPERHGRCFLALCGCARKREAEHEQLVERKAGASDLSFGELAWSVDGDERIRAER